MLLPRENALIILVFALISSALIASHEPWRDEADIWLIGRDLPDPVSVINMAGYEGTPVLWIMMVFLLAKAGLPYISMFILHFLLMLFALIAFLAYSPFTRAQKLLFSFGYYAIYLYSIVARNYVLFVLFLFLIAAAHRDRMKKPFLYSVLIILLANSSAHGLIAAVVIAGAYFLGASPFRKAGLKHAAPALIIILGIGAAILQLLPPQDLGFRGTWFLSADRFSIVANSALRAFFPVSQGLISPTIGLLGIPVFLISLGFFIRKPRVLLMYAISALGVLSVSFLRGYGGARHDGLVFILFVFCLWISKEHKDSPLITSKPLLRVFSRKNLSRLFTLILAFHVASAAVASYMGVTRDFSEGRNAAMFLIENGFAGNDTLIASYPSYSAGTMMPYMPVANQKFYCLEYQYRCSFMLWNDTYYRNNNLSLSEIMGRVDAAASGRGFRSVILILNRNETAPAFLERYRLLAQFDKPIISDEVYYIYLQNQ
jgi:hypothetical protein